MGGAPESTLITQAVLTNFSSGLGEERGARTTPVFLLVRLLEAVSADEISRESLGGEKGRGLGRSPKGPQHVMTGEKRVSLPWRQD